MKPNVSWSLELRVACRPFATYQAIATESVSGTDALLSLLKWLLCVGTFISFVTAGRLVWFHVPLSAAAWSFSPLLQAGWIWGVSKLARPTSTWPPLVRLHFAGQGPFYFLLLLLSALCLFSPQSWPVFRVLISSGSVAVVVLLFFLWSSLLTYAFFRSALSLSVAKALGATSFYYTGYILSLATYFLLTHQLTPLFAHPP